MSEHSEEFIASEDVEGHRAAPVLPDEDDVEGHVQPRRDIDVER